jgi:hypothetical protein
VTARLLVHDLRSGLPAREGEVDLALDVFVYKHQIQPDERRAYREELARALAAEVADGLTLVMVWRQERMGVMHGRRYRRRTFATLWRRV